MPKRGQFSVNIIPVGTVFGRLKVVSERQGEYLRCRCECGNETNARVYRLLDGHTKSCGCLRSLWSKENRVVHGFARTPTYRSWTMMKARCLNPHFPKYPQYGGRGISICERWLNFEDFLADMGERPEGTTLHRLDNDGNYEPDNCSWSTLKRQARNTRASRMITFDNRTQSLADWADEFGLNQYTLWNRVTTYGWSIKDALTTPVLKSDERKYPFKPDDAWRQWKGERMREVHAADPTIRLRSAATYKQRNKTRMV